MSTLYRSDITRLEIEGQFQLLKALVLEAKDSDVSSELSSSSAFHAKVDALLRQANEALLTDLELRISAFFGVLEAILLREDLAQLKKEFAAAAVATKALKTARKVAEDGAKNLTVRRVDKGLEKLFDGLGKLKDGLDAIAEAGVDDKNLNKARDDLEKALKAADEAAKKDEEKTGETGDDKPKDDAKGTGGGGRSKPKDK